MIKTQKPHEIYAIKKPSDFLIFVKNIFRIFEKSGFLLKEKGYYTSVRWSHQYNCFVLDNGTNKNRDICGINLDNLSYYYDLDSDVYKIYRKILTNIKNSDSLNDIFEKYNLKKNFTKCIILYLSNESYYVKGIFQICSTKKREGCLCHNNEKYKVISVLDEVNNEITNSIKANTQKVLTIKNYIKTYSDFIQFINNKKYTVLSENMFLDLENILHKNKSFVKADKNRTYSDYKAFISSNNDNKIQYYELFFLERALLEFIQSLGYENFVCFDKTTNKFLSLPDYNSQTATKNDEKEENINYSLNLLPKII